MRNAVTAVEVFARADDLQVATSLIAEFETLRLAFACVPVANNELSQTRSSVLPQDSLRALEAIDAASHDDASLLLAALASLPQGQTVLTELKAVYAKKAAHAKPLAELADIKKEISDAAAGTENPVPVAWKEVYDKLVAIDIKVKGKPEHCHIAPLKSEWIQATSRIMMQWLDFFSPIPSLYISLLAGCKLVKLQLI